MKGLLFIGGVTLWVILCFQALPLARGLPMELGVPVCIFGLMLVISGIALLVHLIWYSSIWGQAKTLKTRKAGDAKKMSRD